MKSRTVLRLNVRRQSSDCRHEAIACDFKSAIGMSVNDNKKKCQSALTCWYLTGATASGKTAVSLEMAKRIDAEIVSLDSMAIYREMNIGTAKPTANEIAVVPHHLIDICDPNESFSVSQYRESALQKIDEIKGRGKEVLFVGGTALYLKALLRGMFEGPPADWDFRNQVTKDIEDMGADFLHQRLAMVDPVSAHNLHPNDHRRIIRALEVHKATGKPISHWQMQFDEGHQEDECRVFTIRHPRAILHERMEARVDRMFEAGLVDEVRGILDQWKELGQTAAQAVGYKEAIALIKDDVPMEETIERVRVRTRRFGRHQETWFRGLSECRMIDLEEEFDPAEIAENLVEIGNAVSIKQ
jgi:tRNA dimethylallyltransferase